MAYVAFVPARSGSKRVPGKNIKSLAGKPLVLWTLEAFVNCDRIDTVVFSTDSMEYWDIASRYLPPDKLKLDLRTADEAGDKVKVFDYLRQHHAKIFRGMGTDFIMGLPTVPFRNARQVTEAIELYEHSGKPVFSATEYGFPVSFAFYADEVEGWRPVFEACPMVTGNTRSQDQAKAYHPNGAIYVRSIKDLSDPEINTLYHGAVPYLMDRNHSVDIDNESDFLVASAIASTGLLK
jgi:CMP-N,N'-diacetyllegionaminic acid synthase